MTVKSKPNCTTLVSASPCSAYAYTLNRHKVDSLESLISTVRLLKECKEEFIAVYEAKKLKAVWSLTGDDCGDWYELTRPHQSSWRYVTKIFDN
jgi:hypothetical protein